MVIASFILLKTLYPSGVVSLNSQHAAHQRHESCNTDDEDFGDMHFLHFLCKDRSVKNVYLTELNLMQDTSINSRDS